MSVVESISNRFGLLIQRLWNFFQPILDVLSYIGAIFKTIRYWITSLLSGLWDLIVDVIQWWVFYNVWNAFTQISSYIWWPATVFIASMLFIIMIRIFIAFIFKLFRLNIDYHSLNYKNKWWNENPNGYDYRKK